MTFILFKGEIGIQISCRQLMTIQNSILNDLSEKRLENCCFSKVAQSSIK